MPYKTVRIRPQGLNKDTIPGGIPEQWTSLTNFLQRDETLHRARKDQPIGNDASTIGLSSHQHVIPFDRGTLTSVPELLILSNSGLWHIASWRAAAVLVTAVAPYVSPTNNTATSDVINNLPFWTAGTTGGGDLPVYFTPSTGVAAAFPGLPATWNSVNAVRRYRDFVLVLGIDSTGVNPDLFDQVSWSDRAAPGAFPTTFTPISTNEAGDLRLPGYGKVVDGAPLGDGFIVYKNTTAHLLREVGLANGVIGARQVSSNVGLAARNAVTVIDNVHYLVTGDDIVAFDGREARSLMPSGLRHWFFNSELNLDERDRIFTVFDPEYREFWVFYVPKVASLVNRALVFNGQKWSVRNVGITSTVSLGLNSGTTNTGLAHAALMPTRNPTETDPIPLTDGPYRGNFIVGVSPIATTSDEAVLLAVGTARADNTMVSAAEVKGIELQPGKRSMLARVRPVGHDLGDLTITVAGSDDPASGGVYTNSQGQSWTTDQAQGAQFSVDARYHSIGIVIDATQDTPMRLRGFDVDFEVSGTLS